MKCSNCQSENPTGANFCMKCGQSLANACPNCGTELPAEAIFCFKCGYKIAVKEPAINAPTSSVPSSETAPSHLHRYIPKELLSKLERAREQGTMSGERRIVTMLFCDIKGSTAAAGQLDPEEWAEIINGAFEHLIKPVYRYEGTVARLMGDAILAFFGAPIAHEDDPQRAVLAGLDILKGIQPYREQIQRRWDLDFDVRIGINTGLVVVGAVGSDLRMEYTALGDAINLAARMEQTAEPGTIQITEDTQKLIAPLFEFEDLGPMEIRGKEHPVRTFRVLETKAQPGRLRGIEGLESPLVGRDTEMHMLREAVIALRQGRGQVVSVIGDAGLGKSRLIAELRKSPTPIASANGRLQWIEGRSLSYELNTPYAPFVRLLEDCFGLHQQQSAQGKYERIADNVATVLSNRVDEIAPFIASLLGIDLTGTAQERVRFLDPPQLRSKVFQAVADYFEALAIVRPLILVFDDLHWVDPTSLELLEQLLPLCERAMIMIIALFRPRRQELSWRFHETTERNYSHRYTAIQIRPLDEDSCRDLVANLLYVEDLPLAVRNLILAKSEGNPFFVEEVIRSLLDAGLVVKQNGHWHATREIEDIAIPDTLSAVLITRLDRLDDLAKQVLQTAAVIGRQFRYDILADVSRSPQGLEPALTELQRRELIRETGQQPQRIYMFKHVLTQEAAYQSLLLKNRRELNHLVGESLERREPGRVNDIARHFQEAGQLERAAPYFLKAGDKAAHAYSAAEAIGYYRTALKNLDAGTDLGLIRKAYEGLGSTLTFANQIPQAITTYNEMLDLAKETNDAPMQVSALNKLAFLNALRLGNFQEAEQHLTKADQLARTNDDKAGLSEMGLVRCMMCTAVADFEGVVRYMDETVAIGRELAIEEQMALGMAHIAFSQVNMLQFGEANKTLEEGLAITRRIGDLEHEAELLINTAALLHFCNGDLQTARQAVEDGLAIANRIGSLQTLPGGLRLLGMIAHQRGDYEEALDHLKQYLQISRQGGLPWFQAEALCLIGTVYLDISPALLDRVLEHHDQAEHLLAQPAGAMIGASVWTELGSCALAVGDVTKASGFFQAGLTNPTITMNLERPRLLHGQAMVALTQNKLDEATDYLAQAWQQAKKAKLRVFYPLLELGQAQLNNVRGDKEQAIEQFVRAGQLAATMGMRPLEWKAQIGASYVLEDRGRFEEAKTNRQEAMATIEEIARHFQSDEFRAMFIDNTRDYRLLEPV